ncbi:MAG: ATP-binding protein [Planctomycetota bacterium]
MNLQFLSLITTAIAVVGAALATRALAGPAPDLPWLILGAGLVLAAVLLQLFGWRCCSRAVSRFREWCEAASGDPAPLPDLPEPLRRFASLARHRLDDLLAEVNARRSEARRARVAQRTVTRRHAVLHSLLESLSDGVLLVDDSGVPTLANRAARQFLGLPEQGALPESVSGLGAAPSLMAALRKGLDGTGREDRASRDVDCSDQTERRILRVRFLEVASPDAGHDEASLAVLLTDVTREVEINLMKSSFASSVSHELKTPLCSMRAFLEMLIDGDIDGAEDQRKHLQLVMDETERLSLLIQNLLNLSRLEAGITRMERQPVSLPDILEHLRDVVTPLAHARKQTIVFEVSDFVPTVTGDRNLLEQAFMNLISNAVKYTQEGGRIRIRAGLAGRDVELSVADSGVGIPEKALDLVFEKFTRVENSAGLQATGTGLGLPLARFVATAHGGSISVTSKVGEGSEFKILLPVRRAEESDESKLVGLEGIAG